MSQLIASYPHWKPGQDCFSYVAILSLILGTQKYFKDFLQFFSLFPADSVLVYLQKGINTS